jgi:molybdopterin/thiamine biosynthesis adenylyltransferase/rhodanese-related sulfurtransferase
MSFTQNNERYHRQIILKEFGETAQQKLLHAKVLVIGAGGLGCPALQYLAAAGVGKIGIIDFDVVTISNLHRQILFSTNDIGKQKATTAASKLAEINPKIQIQAYNFQLTNKNTFEIFTNYDIIIDGTDNFATRYLINDACVILNKPLVYGAVLRFEGQVGVFNLMDNETQIKTNYRDLFPEPPNPLNALSCNEAGVIGVLPGIIGTMQATEAIKIITGVGMPLHNKIISYNALQNTFYDFEITPVLNPIETFPQNEMEFLNFNYEWFCHSKANVSSISIIDFEELRINEKITIIDVRERNELPLVNEFDFISIPLNDLPNLLANIPIENKIVVFCKSGNSSLKAVKILNEEQPQLIAYSLTGGLDAWQQFNNKN